MAKKKLDINECIFEKEYKRVIPYETNIKCPKCKTGNLINKPDEVNMLNGELHYRHYCNNPNCKNSENIKNTFYPRVEYFEEIILNIEEKSFKEEKENKKSITLGEKIKNLFKV